MSPTHRHVVFAFVLASVLTGVSIGVGLNAGWIDSVNSLEAFAVWTSYACTYLCVKQSRWNFPVGAVSVAAYCTLFWQHGLYASMALNAYLVPALIYGWFRWGRDDDTRSVGWIEWKLWAWSYVALTAITFYATAKLSEWLGGSMPLPDAAILIGSILAQFLLSQKRIETWAVWILVNVVAIGVYSNAGLHLASLQYVFFLGNAFYGFSQWHKSMKKGAAYV